MELGLVRDIGIKALLAGGGSLLLFWIYTAVKLVLSARGINPLIKQFFTQVAAGRIDAAYLLTTKAYRQHVTRQQFIRFLADLKLNKFRNLKSGRPRIQEGDVILTVKHKAETGDDEMPLDFTFTKVDDNWRIARINRVNG
jgi:predicted SnoaL-like aldol condensation-catalyzing enzyme